MGSFVMLSRVDETVFDLESFMPDSGKDFNSDKWYAFAEVTEGDESSIEALNVDPTSWYSPESIVNANCSVVVDRTFEESHPDWWATMIEHRGNPRKSFWSGELKFDPPEENPEDLGYPDLYSD